MKESITARRSQILSKEGIDRHLGQMGVKVQLTEDDYHRMIHSQSSNYLNNILVGDRVIEGKIRTRLNTKTGKFEYHIEAYKPKLNIDRKEVSSVLNRPASLKDLEDLEKGKKIGPIKEGNGEYFVSVDKELNKITKHSTEYLGIPRQFADYKFSQVEKENLANGMNVGPKVFKIGKDQYVLGSYSINPSITNYSQSLEIFKHDLSKEEVQKLSKLYNQVPQVDPKSSKMYQNQPTGIVGDSKILGEKNPRVDNDQDKKRTFDNRYNKTFNFFHFSASEKDEKFNQMLKTTFTSSELDNLKSSQGVFKAMINSKGEAYTTTAFLNIVDGKQTLILTDSKLTRLNLEDGKPIVPQIIQTPKLQLFTELDKQVLNFVDRKGFKELNEIAKAGYKPSEDIQRLIVNSPKLDFQDKLTASHILGFDQHKLLAIHSGQNLPANLREKQSLALKNNSNNGPTPLSIPVVNAKENRQDKRQDKGQIQNHHKNHDTINAIQRALGDM